MTMNILSRLFRKEMFVSPGDVTIHLWGDNQIRFVKTRGKRLPTKIVFEKEE